jgi:uncharacterized UPF0146 family protein
VLDATRRALVSRLSHYETVVEVGIGTRTSVARALATAAVAVTATDVRERATPSEVSFVVDDVTDPTRGIYAGADAIYGLNLPPELHRPALALAREVDADLLFTTLGGDQPLVPVERETLPGETLYVAR